MSLVLEQAPSVIADAPRSACAVKKLPTLFRRETSDGRWVSLAGWPIVVLTLLYSVFRLLLEASSIGVGMTPKSGLSSWALRHQLGVLQR